MKMKHLILFVTICFAQMAWSNPYVIRHNFSDTYLKVEVLKNRGLHFEIVKTRPGADRIWTSPMIANLPALNQQVEIMGNTINTEDFILKVNQDNLCVSINDRHQDWDFVTTCPHNMERPWKGLALFTNDARNAYGLGAYYQNPGTSDGDWVGKVWDPLADTMGNALRSFSKGAQSYAMFPVLYVLGSANRNYMILHDSVYKQMWSLNQSPWKIESSESEIRWFIFTDKNVKKLRQKFMSLTGKPPVPPKPAFGMWLSEFGYENWDEVNEEVDSMHAAGLPVDGMALDLQWFGGDFFIGNVDRTNSRFGTLEFDSKNFPNPKETISRLKNDKGVVLMTIEESYISQWLGEFTLLDHKGFMAKNCGSTSSTILTAKPWWGIGGMIDWTNPQAGLYWHNLKRQKLYELGINYHWTDLGEPEMYDARSCYYGLPKLKKHTHADIHNIYNLKWIESIASGYQSNRNEKRPFTMSRSGTIGVQRYGAALWSGDIAANMGALTAHYNVQMHMSYSGVDYFGSDIGGFHRRADTLDGDQEELYTQWFANAALFDFPVRAHTWNLNNQLETAPSKIGDLESNRYNLGLRYQLSPYYYSLAHMAHLEGLPVISPMSLEFPEDLTVRQMGNEKMIGPHLLAAMSARYGENYRSVYLPKGEWINFHTGKHYVSMGSTFHHIITRDNGIFRLPLFVRKGAIVPLQTSMPGMRSNISGKLFNGKINNDITLLVYPSTNLTEFTLFEDDGETVSYKNGFVAKTRVTQQHLANKTYISISKVEGKYVGMPSSKNYRLKVYTPSRVETVSINGIKLRTCEMALIDKSQCFHDREKEVLINLGEKSNQSSYEVVLE